MPVAPDSGSSGPGAFSITVVVSAYTLDRWHVLEENIASLLRQTLPAEQVILVIDHNDELLQRAREAFPQIEVLASEGERGASAARNLAIRQARGDIIACIDDDAVAVDKWLEELTAPYVDPDVLGTSGMPEPRWVNGEAPSWLPFEFYWTIGCGYGGLPTTVAQIRNPIGASMSLRRIVFERVGEFSSGFGPNMSKPGPHGGGEETELAIRAAKEFPHGKIVHVPEAKVEHVVSAERTTWRYYLNRCRLEGRMKALLVQEHGSMEGLSSERTYTLRTLPRGVLRGLGDALRGDLSGLQRAAAIVAGLAYTAAGYGFGRARQLLRP